MTKTYLLFELLQDDYLSLLEFNGLMNVHFYNL